MSMDESDDIGHVDVEHVTPDIADAKSNPDSRG